MVTILISATSPRLEYAFEIVFRYILNVPYRFTTPEQNSEGPQEVRIDYTQDGGHGGIRIPVSGFCHENSLRPYLPPCRNTEIPYLFYEPENKGDLEYDLFAAVFYLATEYEKQADPKYDKYGRYDEKAYASVREKWHAEPLAHVYSLELWHLIETRFPEAARTPRKFDYEVTFDIDHPWKYLHKGPIVTLAGLAKRLIGGKWKDFREQMTTLLTRRDPYYTFSAITASFSPAHTRIFYLIDRHHPNDTRFTYRHKRLRALVRELVQQGYGTGIHPSFTTFLNRERIAGEATRLREITDKPVVHSRQHFLLYRLPETFRYLIDAGITHEYTLGMYSDAGFRTGMAVPYPWFDLDRNEATGLILHPTLMMDRTLQHYLKLTPSEGREKLNSIIEKTRKAGGRFTILLHNDALSDSGEWKGWRSVFIDLGELLK